MHGPLICYPCRLLLKEDEAHEKEQQEYKDKREAKRQAQYDAQLAGTAEDTKHQNIPQDNATQTKNNASSQESLVVPNSPPTQPETGWGFPQNFVRITLATI
jgi:hypothetical protein